jgi:hypothetical protein
MGLPACDPCGGAVRFALAVPVTTRESQIRRDEPYSREQSPGWGSSHMEAALSVIA